MSSPYAAGYFYCPYIPLQIWKSPSPAEWRKRRKEYLLQCPSFPYTCTGECHTEAYKQKVESVLDKEFSLSMTKLHVEDQKVDQKVGLKTRYDK